MKKYCTLSHTVLQFVLALRLLSGDRFQIFRDTSNWLLNTHNIPTDLQCYDVFHGSSGKFYAKYWKTADPHRLSRVALISDIASCIFHPYHYAWEMH